MLQYNVLNCLCTWYLQTDEWREVSHYQFTSWPDYGVPHSALAMLDFLDRVRQQQSKMVMTLGDTWAGHPRGPPIVVHCSAGIGRTGKVTFIRGNTKHVCLISKYILQTLSCLLSDTVYLQIWCSFDHVSLIWNDGRDQLDETMMIYWYSTNWTCFGQFFAHLQER
jgi:hypothetical protein